MSWKPAPAALDNFKALAILIGLTAILSASVLTGMYRAGPAESSAGAAVTEAASAK